MFPDKQLVSFSELRFLSKSQIEDLLLWGGPGAQRGLWGWDEQPLGAASSDDIVFLVEAV